MERVLSDEIDVITLPCAGVGARHASLVHKLHGKFHQTRLHMPSSRALQVFCCKCTVSHTTDMGTELMFNDVETDIARFTTQFADPLVLRPAPASFLDILSGDGDVAGDVQTQRCADSENQGRLSDVQTEGKARVHGWSITIPGLLHMLHNDVVDMTDALENFQWFFKPFNGLLKFMNRTIHRTLVLGTCFSKPPASHWRKQIKRIHGKI